MSVDVSKLVEKAREAAERRNFDYAIDLYLQACKMAPDDPAPRRELRTVENRLAKERGTSFLERSKAQFLLLHTRGLLVTKKYESAMEKAEETLKIDPTNVSAMMLLGQAALKANYRKAAISTFEDIKNINAGGNNKQLVNAMRELGRVYETEGKINDAQEIWQLVIKASPGDREATIKIRDLSAKSMTSIIEGAAISGKRGSVATSLQTAGQTKEAAKADRASSELRTSSDVKAAIEDAKEEIQQRPNDPRVYAKIGDLYLKSKDYAQAKTAFEMARQKDLNNPTWLFKLHDLEIWKMTTAAKALQAKARSGDQAARDKYQADRKALLEYRLNSFVEREKQYSTHTGIRYELGTIYFELARDRGDKSLYDEAIKRYQATFRDPKFHTESGLRMGVAFAAKGQFELALKRFDETLADMELKNEAWKSLMYSKADTLDKMGKPEDAKKIFLEVYEIDVSFRDVAKRVDALSQPQGGNGNQAPEN